MPSPDGAEQQLGHDRGFTGESNPSAPMTRSGIAGAKWNFFGHVVDSPLGVAAGPLLNGDWCEHYADLGFDVLTYKTVRSVARRCYSMPNLQPVESHVMTGFESEVRTCSKMSGSWAVSFGMPSSDPLVWRKDVERTRHRLSRRKVLSVSVVGTQREGWSLDQLAEDYAKCACWAIESGADMIEANFSCPNVSTCDGQLYQSAEESTLVAQCIRDAIGDAPLVIKIGFIEEMSSVQKLVSALDGTIDGFSMTNSLAARVRDDRGNLLFDAEPRGICGRGIREQSILQVSRFRKVIEQADSQLKIIGVGGVSSGRHVDSYLKAGADACHLATSAMLEPSIAMRIRSELINESNSNGGSLVDHC
ncbi:hypothetical protein OAA27_02285 [bacterium]|nr:hypothetical protein [bacterium]